MKKPPLASMSRPLRVTRTASVAQDKEAAQISDDDVLLLDHTCPVSLVDL